MVVKFLRGYPPYNAGEVAGFEDGVANDLIRKGVADLYKPEVLAEAVAEPPGDRAVKEAKTKRGR